MSTKPYDATLKDLIEEDGAAWAGLIRSVPVRRATVIDADVSTVTAASDKVVRVEDDLGEWLLNLDPLSSRDPEYPERLHLYSTILGRRHRLRVRSVALLLRREANASNLTGVLEERHPDEELPYLVFRYHVVHVWRLGLAPLLQGGLGTLPLAALTDEAEADLPGVIEQIDRRLQKDAAPAWRAKALAATYVLLGLRYPDVVIEPLFRGVTGMEESSTYQLIKAKGRVEGTVEEARKFLLRLGRRKLGEPDAATLLAVEGLTDLERLEALGERLLIVSSWQELLAP
jgi:hypothetical protein